MRRLVLLRHGRTEGTERHLYYGATDLPLLPVGIAELKTLRARGIYPDPAGFCFVTSGMLRANQTLQTIYGDVPYLTAPRLREVDFGIFEMKSYDALKDDPAYQTWLSGDNEANIPPLGESGNQMRLRVLEALEEIREDTVLVTHGGVIAAIMEALFPEEGKNRYQWQSAPGHGYKIRLESAFSPEMLHFSRSYAIL